MRWVLSSQQNLRNIDESMLFYSNDSSWKQERLYSWRQHFNDFSFHEYSRIKAYRDYFFSGDLNAFHEAEENAFLSEILILSPIPDFCDLKRKVISHWFWTLEDPQHRGEFGVKNLRERFFFPIYSFLEEHQFVNSDIAAALFCWVFGDRYDEDRIFSIEYNGKVWQEKPLINPHQFSIKFIQSISSYLYDDVVYKGDEAYSHLVDYFFSLTDYIDPMVFNTKLFGEGGEPGTKGHVVSDSEKRSMRHLMARMQGIGTEYDEENEPQINDGRLEEHFKKRWSEVTWHEKYETLVDFINRHKYCCINASE